MNDVNPPVTYVRDPALVPPVTPVYLVSGSLSFNLSPSDIVLWPPGALKDINSGYEFEILRASTAKSSSNNVILVQNVDTNGEVVLRDDIQNIDAGVTDIISHLSAVQDNGSRANSLLTTILNNGTTTPGTFNLFTNATSPGPSTNVNVSPWLYHTFQHVISGSVVVQVRSSLDGTNWNIEDETNQNSLVDLCGKVKFLSANIVYINGSVTTILMSGN